MAGRARHAALTAELTKRAHEEFDWRPGDDETEPTHLQYVCWWLEGARTLKALCEDISACLGWIVDPAALQRYLRGIWGETAESEIDAARTRASHLYAEDAISIVDEDQSDNVGVSRAASRARSRQWLAERYNRAKYGNQAGPVVAISIGQLHLDALRATQLLPSMQASHALPSPIVTTDEVAQVVE